jgi:hypothetical protein
VSLRPLGRDATLGRVSSSRRRFLGWVAAGAVTGGVGVAAIRASGYRVPGDVGAKLVTFSAWQYVVMDAVGRRVIAPESADVGLFADSYFAGLADSDRADLVGLLAYIEHVAPLAQGFASRFSSLDGARQDRVLVALERSPVGLVRGGFQAVKAIAMMACYRRDESFLALGYSGPVVRWSGR